MIKFWILILLFKLLGIFVNKSIKEIYQILIIAWIWFSKRRVKIYCQVIVYINLGKINETFRASFRVTHFRMTRNLILKEQKLLSFIRNDVYKTQVVKIKKPFRLGRMFQSAAMFLQPSNSRQLKWLKRIQLKIRFQQPSVEKATQKGTMQWVL